MTELSDQWIAIIAVATSLMIGWMIFRVARLRRGRRESLVPSEVRERSHEVANEATKVRAGLRRIGKSPNPLDELVATLRHHNNNNGGCA